MNNLLINTKYLKNKSSIKFLLTEKDKFDSNAIENMFDGFLDNLLILEYLDYYVILYTNKEYVNFRDYYDSISFDFGNSLKFIEGIKVDIDNIDDIEVIIDLFNKYFKDSQNNYYSVKDLILKANLEETKILKDILLRKYDLDLFNSFVKGLMENDLNVSKSASKLYMHRNTINNKIETFKNDTGLRMQKFIDAVAIYKLCSLHIE